MTSGRTSVWWTRKKASIVRSRFSFHALQAYTSNHASPWRKALLYNLCVLYTTGVGEAAVKLMHHYTSVFEHVGGVSEVEAKIEAFSDHAGFPQLNGQRRPWRWRRWRQRQRWWR